MEKDITKTGPVGLKGLTGLNRTPAEKYIEDFDTMYRGQTILDPNQVNSQYQQSAIQDSGLLQAEVGYGNSKFDDGISESQLHNINEARAIQQPWYDKFGNAITKGVSLAGTTFLDGTLGLVYGIGSAIGHGDISKLWDNEVSNGLQEWNKRMEEWLPNYKTEEEQNMSVLEKMGTVNFWADSLLKNLGFTVGAIYSGGIWTKGLKAIGAVTTGMGAKVVGSVLSAVNEGRIEANNNTDDWKELKYTELRDSYNATVEAIKNNVELNGLQKELAIAQLSENMAKEEASIEDRATKVGLVDFIGNTVLLSLDNFYTFGRLYARGFKNAKDKVADNVKRTLNEAADDVAAREAIDEAGKRIVKDGSRYTYDAISKKRMVGRGLASAAREGNEELAQQWIANTSGELQNYDSPDAYYNAILDPEAERQTKDFMTAATQGFMDSYGNGDQWEQFAVGALTGLIGVPTFGSVSNSDANTWLGRGKKVGISGGIFGEIGEANRQNREGQEAVDYMNQYMDKLQERQRHFVQSQSFTNAMDGWAEENNAFEYKNAEDNDDFAAISRFAKTGKLNDLKDMVKQDFENISDEELDQIARFTTEEDSRGGWRNTDGSYMSESEEGLATMRSELANKRDKILSEIDRYEQSIQNVRAIGNNSLDEDQVNELAWLDWKVGRFDDRFNSIKEENADLFTSLSNGLLNFRDTIDEKTEEGQKWLKSLNNMIDFISYLQGAKSSLDLAGRIGANKKLMDTLSDEDAFDLFADNSGLSYSAYKEAMDNLRDAAKISTAAKTFNERYREFVEDPMKLIKNREEITTKKENLAQASNNISAREKVEESSVSDLVASVEEGDTELDSMESLFSPEDSPFLDDGTLTGKGKVEEAKKIINTSNAIAGAGGILDEIATNDPDKQQAVEDARKMLEASKSKAESEEELLNLETESFNDPQLLLDEDSSVDPANFDQQELADSLDDRVANVKTLMEEVKAVLGDRRSKIEDIPTGSTDGVVESTLGEDYVGHDATEKGVPVNEPKKEEETKPTRAEEAKAAAEANPPIAKDVQEILSAIDDLYRMGASDSEIGTRVGEMAAYKRVMATDPMLAAAFQSHLQNLKEADKPAPKPNTYSAESEEIPTTPITTSEVINASDAQRKQDLNKGEITKEYLYWKRTTTEYPIHFTKGDSTPYYVIAETVERHNYTDQQRRRMKAVYNYLKSHGAYDIVNNGELKKGDKIGFFIDKSLNDEAGEIVILMTDSKGRVVGDIMSKNDKPFSYQVGLPAFVERTEKAYKEAGEPATFTSNESTVVDKNMVGFAPYTADTETMHTLNEIHTQAVTLSDGSVTNAQVPFTLGIALTSGTNARLAATAGRRKKQGQSELEKTIIPPLQAKAGQPYLLLPTSSDRRAFLPVPFMMPSYSSSLDNTMLGKAVTSVIEKLRHVTNNDAMKVKRELQELVAIPEVHINILDNGNLKVTIKPLTHDKQITIFNGSQADPELVSKIKAGLEGQPIQVSRKYVNDTYLGADYNRMIGEIAMTNLPIGTTHTVGEWFTVAPLGENGEILKAKSPKSSGQNPNQAAPTYREVPYKDKTLRVNTKTYEVSDETGKTNGPKADLVRAEAWGYINNAPTDKPFNTQWGWFDPVSKKFVDEPKVEVVQRTLGLENPTSLAKSKGLLNNPVRKALWEVLTPDQQSIIANKKGPKQAQWMDALERAFNSGTKTFDENKLKGTVDDLLNRKGLYRRSTEAYSTWNRGQELKWLKRVLPNFSNEEHTRVVDGLIKIAGENAHAWGQFKQGVIYLSNQAARGTTYHEAFHAVTHTLLTNSERAEMFREAKKKYGDLPLLAIEENLAEDFRRYTQVEELPLLGGLVKFFRMLKHLVQNLVGKEPYLDAMFYRINRGDFGNRTVKKSNATRNRRDPYEIQQAITKLKNDYKIAEVHENSMRSTSPTPVDDTIQSLGLSNVLFRYQQNGNGMYSIARISKDTYEKKMAALRNELNSSWNSELSDDVRRSDELLEEQEAYYRRVEQYHRDKMMYGNLTQEDKDYIQARKITKEEYNRMSPLEKEILFRCRY